MADISVNIGDIRILGNWEDIVNAQPLAPFDDVVIGFFNDLSKLLTREREYSDVATFGFWCRRASLLKMKAEYDDIDERLGRGIVFHSTPSNVPVNFAFSFAAGLLAGNANIVRLPGNDFEQVDIITNAVDELVRDKHKNIAPYICFVKYPPDKKLHGKFSNICDVRIIWGGDATINELRQSPLKPRATEITFADRYSIAVINADEYINAQDKTKIAQDFYNDTYFTDQNACTAPRVIFWLGREKDKAKKEFWGSIKNLTKEKYELAPVQVVGKLASFYKAATAIPVSLVKDNDNYVTRIDVTDVNEDLLQYKYNSGFFFEHDIDALRDILPVCGNRLQSLIYFGVSQEDIKTFIFEHRPRGIDRAVPIGSSMDFSLIWDGCDLIRQLSRRISVE